MEPARFVPRRHQQLAISWAIDKPKCGIFLDMSLGKTAIALTVIQMLRALGEGAKRVLVIAPKRVADLVWTEEARKWGHTQELSVAIALGPEGNRAKALAAGADITCINRENVVIIDESSSFKNHDSKRFKKLKGPLQQVPRVILLTGTPAPRNYENLWAQLFLLDGGERLGKNITAFRARYMMQNFSGFGYQLRAGAKKAIDDRISDICLSFQAEDFADMPEATHEDVTFPLPEEAAAAYRIFERDRVADLASGDVVVALSAASIFGKLLQFANGAIYKEREDGEREFEVVHAAKIEALLELIDKLDGENIVIAYAFKHDLERLKAKTAKDYEDWNRGDIRILLGHPASMGHGLNLQYGGHIAVWFGLPLDLELYLQFNARLPRPGQNRPVTIYHLLAEGTADAKAYKLLKEKNISQKSLMQALSAIAPGRNQKL